MAEQDSFRTGFIALIGRPNVGKSTLMNRLIGMKVAITSNKPQTTRCRIRTVVTDERSQMIFLDSPGIIEPKNKLGERMMLVAGDVKKDADVILWLLDADQPLGEKELQIGDDLSRVRQNVIVVLNKADIAGEEKCDALAAQIQERFPFAQCARVSALKGQQIEALKEMITEMLPYGPALYEEDALTDMPEREVVAEIIREKALRLLSDEVPHGIAVVTQTMRERPNGLIDIHADVICEKDSHKGIVIGKNGRMLRKIGSDARVDIEKLLDAHVNLQLFVKVRAGWRDDARQLKNFGLWMEDR